jgi:very-short-patch-repair endonuclease
MRFALTESERLLWSALRGCRLGTHFKRQVPVGGRYIADFLAPARRLVVEIDGPYHARRQRADARREAVLRRWGYRVLRLDAQLVERELGVAVARIREELGHLTR